MRNEGTGRLRAHASWPVAFCLAPRWCGTRADGMERSVPSFLIPARIPREGSESFMSTTPAERRALLFLAGVACLGVGVRAAGAVRREPPRPEQRSALARQLEAVDSARAAGRSKKGAAGRRQWGGAREGRGERGPRGQRRESRAERGVSRPPPAAPQPVYAVPVGPVDADVATAAELEALPRVGPALAARIVADRERLGPFGSLEALGRVRGVGPALLKILQDRVTFSGTPRLPHDIRPPPRAGVNRPSAALPTPSDRSRRRRRQ